MHVRPQPQPNFEFEMNKQADEGRSGMALHVFIFAARCGYFLVHCLPALQSAFVKAPGPGPGAIQFRGLACSHDDERSRHHETPLVDGEGVICRHWRG
jgi:hypothetical protein